MKRIVPLLCPVLLAVFPVLSLFAQNQTEVELSVLWMPLALSGLAAIVLFGMFLLITKRAAKAGVLASLVVVAFFYYGVFTENSSSWVLTLWILLFGLALASAFRTRRDLFNLTAVLAVGAAFMTLPQAAGVASYQANHPSVSAADPRLWPTTLEPPVVPSGTRPPDIYVIVPDDYARIDILKQYFHYDDTEFVHQLEARGFVLSEQARSPYSDSESNIASMLNMDYLTNFPRVLGQDSEDVRPVKRVMEDNRAARLLSSVGYNYVHLDTDEVTFAGGNPDISPLAPPDSFMNLWLSKSILGQVGGALGFNGPARNERFRASIHSEFSKLGSLPSGTEPRFVVFHTLLPHDPYLFDAQGQPVTFPGHSDADLSSQTGRAFYVDQLQFLSGQLLATIDEILANAKTPPVIVIQADEGFQAEPDVFGESAMQDIRVKGLAAFYLPGAAEAGVPYPPNSVNTLRFVFNRYLGTHYEMLRSASYPEGDLPYDFQEIAVK